MPRNARSGPVISILLSFASFLSLLQLFDPLQSTSVPQSVLERGLADFKGLSRATGLNSTTIDSKDRILWLLQDAGVALSSLSEEERQQLPKWQHVIDLYGDNIIVQGQEQCETFRQHVPNPKDRILAVAGLFNTGTNLLNTQFTRNIQGIKTLWQVPWGKHRMAQVKWEHTAHEMEQHNKEHVLPVVIIRDPLAWMQSMCANPYAAKWRHGTHHCPNLVPDELDRQFYRHLPNDNAFGVRIKYDTESQYEFDSLAHLWSDYHLQYMNADYPVLFIRYEDLVFQPKQVLTEIALCVGATVREPLRYQINTSKNHGSGTNWIRAITKTNSAELRKHNLTADDITYLHQHLDSTLMDLFQYPI
ncbi:hypothetical protein FisN_16Lh072 [Fistulifera solaris]|uniref:Sulfotransferase domain-containing protein n=1 Tax=Fistulifera solaris TaxID=1519565 RepID=A0A1Z5KIX2_FISSO|nr:hypothetical protein FisN_16Lh072 [Fistulifera solaris]|eukprot:GAX26244.1 hypothetical protein FisN_16Lh072 [Fistulifera solaris]